MLLPPPNVTGRLHLGHALTCTIQDTIARYKRMQGYKVSWIPGLDHAGIATQSIVERKYGKDNFRENVLKWKNIHSDEIVNQLKVMGCSLDWSKLYFTLDDGHSKIVRDSFLKLYDDGLIYRASRMINWSPFVGSVLSDIEVDHIESEKGKKTFVKFPNRSGKHFNVQIGLLYRIKYQVGEGFIEVCTTRPETIGADVAIAVLPNNPLAGKHATNPLTGKQIPIIPSATFVNPDFGSACVKITPRYDAKDYEFALAHSLDLGDEIMDDDANIFFDGKKMNRFEAREAILTFLGASVIGVEQCGSSVPICSRSGDLIEQRLKEQWFISTQPLVDNLFKHKSDFCFIPAENEKHWERWMHEQRDWCISRQLDWGHKIPMYKDPSGNWIPESQVIDTQCKQDPDVLDTWFSASLLPLTHYPTDLLETGNDLLFFWVSRMLMVCTWLKKQVPFKTVLFHSLIRDKYNKKMSKSVGNVVDPLEIVDQFGVDGLRYSMASVSRQDVIKYDPILAKQGKNFTNKLFHCIKWTVSNSDKTEPEYAEKYILHHLHRTIESVTRGYNEYKFDKSLEAIKDFVKLFSSVYIPLKENHAETSRQCMIQVIQMLHPIMPFCTQDMSAMLGIEEIIISKFPQSIPCFEEEANAFESILEARSRIRSLIYIFNQPTSRKIPLKFVALEDGLECQKKAMLKLFNATELTEGSQMELGITCSKMRLIISFDSNFIDLSEVVERLEQRLSNIQSRLPDTAEASFEKEMLQKEESDLFKIRQLVEKNQTN